MKIHRIIRSLMPYAIVKRHLDQKHDKKRTIPYKKYQERFQQVSKKLEDNGRFTCNWSDKYPCLDDAETSTPFDTHYTYHPAWAARILASTTPKEHIDIASSLNFVVIASAFVPMTFYDYRPAQIELSNLHCDHANIMQLPFKDNSIESLSCMHVVEHIGLERYGDPFDPQGDIKAMNELSRVLKKGGQLLFVVPISGIARINYNAHRVYKFSNIVSSFQGLNLQSFSLVTDEGQFITDATEADANMQHYGCGCFHFIKPE